MSWLDLVLCKCVPVCLAVIPYRYIQKIQQFEYWTVINSKHSWNVSLQAIPQYNAYSWKNGRGLGQLMQDIQLSAKVRGKKELTVTDQHSFQDLSGKFSHSKAIHVLVFSLYTWRKSLLKTILMLLIWETMDRTLATIIQVSWSKLLGARVGGQGEFSRRFTSEQMSFFQ